MFGREVREHFSTHIVLAHSQSHSFAAVKRGLRDTEKAKSAYAMCSTWQEHTYVIGIASGSQVCLFSKADLAV